MSRRFSTLIYTILIYAILGALLLFVQQVLYADTFDIAPGDVSGLISAMYEANGNGVPDTINLAPNSTYTLTQSVDQTYGGNGLPSIVSEITINGNNATIERSSAEGTPSFRILLVYFEGDLSLNDVTILNGIPFTNPFDGGGIMNLETLTATNIVVADCEVSNLGGGFFNGGTATIIDSMFMNNVAAEGGGIANKGREIGGVWYPGSLTVIDSTFSGNWAGDFSVSGALSNSLHGATLTVDGSTISSNVSGGIGTTIESITTITNSIISDHSETGVYSSGGPTTITDSCITDNAQGVFSRPDTPLVDATNNWWGAADGPSGAGPGSGDPVSNNVNFTPFLTEPAPACAPQLDIAIDIKPGSYPNSINLRSNGSVPVAILSSISFDATTIDPTSVTLAGGSVRLKDKKGTPMAYIDDINADGYSDLVVHVETEALTLSEEDVIAELLGKTYSEVQIRGVDSVRIVL